MAYEEPEVVQTDAGALRLVRCKCGRKIVWGMTLDGKKIPLDPLPAIYRRRYHDKKGALIVERDKGAYVTHFATCKNANEFSGGGE